VRFGSEIQVEVAERTDRRKAREQYRKPTKFVVSALIAFAYAK
jgi:hypothetical protein